MNAYEVIKRPLITEKVVRGQEAANTVAFEVTLKASKADVKRAVEQLWKVKVQAVRTVLVRGKVKRFGMHLGKRSNWKKAYVRLQPGDKIDLFTGA